MKKILNKLKTYMSNPKRFKKNIDILLGNIKNWKSDDLKEEMRRFAHQLDVTTKKEKLDKKSRKFNDLLARKTKEIIKLLKERKIPVSEDIKWAEGILKRYEKYIKLGKPLLSRKSLRKEKDFWKVVKGRRSVRVWEKAEIPLDVIKKIVEAGIWAPSSCNRQTWKFICITDQELKDKISLARANKKTPMFCDVSMIILPAINTEVYGFLENNSPMLDAAAAIENILLAAYAEGWGGCWVNWLIQDKSKEKELFKKLGVPKSYRVYSMILVGKPKDVPKPPLRKNIDEVMCLNEFY